MVVIQRSPQRPCDYLQARRALEGHDVSTKKSVRLPDSLSKVVQHLARREHLDESTAIRKLIRMGATGYAVGLYREGKATLREAAELAEATPREMIEILLDHGIRGNVTVDQQRKAIQFILSKS